MRREPEKAAHGQAAGAGLRGADCSAGPGERHSGTPGAVAQGIAEASCAPSNPASNGLSAQLAAEGLPAFAALDGSPTSSASNGMPAKQPSHGLLMNTATNGSPTSTAAHDLPTNPAAHGSPTNPASNGHATNGAHPRLDRAPAIVHAAGIDIGGVLPILIGSIGRGEDGETLGHAARSVAEVGGQFLHWGTIESGPTGSGGEPLAGLSLARKTADACGLGLVGDVEAVEDIAPVAELTDLIHVPSHLMQCFALLLEAGRAGRPVILSRSPAATLEEWLLAAEYLMVGGCPGIVLCEGGIRGFDHPERPVLDLGAVATLRLTHQLPVIVAPGRAAGRHELIQPLARAALAAGAHGLLLPFLPRGGKP